MTHPQDSDLVDIDTDGVVRAILAYPHPEGREVRNLVNAALYVLERAGLEDVTPAEGKADIAKHMFPRMLDLGCPLYGYVSPEYIKDMGTPERLDKVERDFIMGLPERLSGRQLRRAVFLDRDGTINREVTHLKLLDQVELLPGASAAIRCLNRSGTLAVVVTNQPVVARGDVSLEGLGRIHARLGSQLGAGGAYTKYVALMDGDDISSPDRFERQLDFLEKNPEYIAVGCRVTLINEYGSELAQKFKFYEHNATIRKALKYRMPLCHPALMFRTDSLFSVNGYMYGNTAEDHELFLRLARNNGYLFKNLPEKLFLYRRYNNQLTDLRHARNAYCNIAGFMLTEFLRTYNPLYLVGIFAYHPLFGKFRSIFKIVLGGLK